MKYRQLIFVLVGLCLIGITMDLTPQAASAQQCDYYASPDGRGDGLSVSSPFQISDFLSMPENEIRGKTLCLLDGTYYESLNISKSGTASQPISIRALHDGEVTIDGQNSRRPATISGNHIIVEGIVFQNSSSHVVLISGDYNVFRRCSAYYGNFGGNEHAFLIAGGGQYNLLEDCVAAATERHLFITHSDQGIVTGNTYRRCFGVGIIPGKPETSSRSEFNIYGGSEDIIENSIGWGGTEYASVSIHSQGFHDTYANRGNKVLGSIFMNSGKNGGNPDPGFGMYQNVGTSGNQERPKDNYYENNVIYGNTYGFRIKAGCENTQINHLTLVSNGNYGVSLEDSSSFIKNSIIYSNQNGYSGSSGSWSYMDLFNNDSINSLSSCQHCLSVDPQFSPYPARLVIPANSPMKGAGENGSDIGANICYRYENGVLTDVPLWPWPMADRIKKELGIDVMAELEQLFGPIPAECKGEGLREDINLDGSVNSLDVQICGNVLTGWETDADIVKRADVNGDGKVDSTDIQQIVEKILGG